MFSRAETDTLAEHETGDETRGTGVQVNDVPPA